MTWPLYKSESSPPSQYPAGAHAGLWFDKFCDKWDESWSMSTRKLDWLKTITEGTTKGTVGNKEQIEESAIRLIRLVESRGGRWAVYTTESRFVTGLGRSHPVENGFAWHPTLGVPYLPGSSVKGMVRSWVEQESEQGSKDSDLIRLLGKEDNAGKVCILDAVPVAPPQLEADVMTPHYAGWDEDDPPGDWRSPTPIPFLVTAAGTSFLFGVIPVRCASKEDTEWVIKWLGEALEWAGAGAKTAVGYGRFVHDKAKTDALKKLLSEREERIRREQEERERKKRLDSLSKVEREIQEVIDNRQDPGMSDVVAIYQAIASDKWSGDEKTEASQWLATRIKGEGLWKETTQARRPDRDRDHQRTLQVMRWLNEE